MNMLTAIAESAGNKARAIADTGQTIIVQQRFDHHQHWFHVWFIAKNKWTDEVDIDAYNADKIKEEYLVDPEADYWQSV